MLNQELFKNLSEILILKGDDITNELDILKQTVSLSPYEEKFIWLIQQLMSDLHCSSPNEVPFNYLSNAVGDPEVEYDLQKLLALEIGNETKAKVCDCLWIHKKDYASAKKAFDLYFLYIGMNQDFESNYFYLNRVVSIFLSLKSEANKPKLIDVVELVLSQGDNIKNFFPLNILEICFVNGLIDNDCLISKCNAKLEIVRIP